MREIFEYAENFNQPLDNWDVSNVSDFLQVFRYASSFDQNINSWNMTNATRLQGMFDNAISFNQPLDNWDVSNVDNMAVMFENANTFNQPLDSWDVSNVDRMDGMFEDAVSFDQPLDKWELRSSGVDMTEMLDRCGMSVENYSKTLVGWANSVALNSGPLTVELGAENLEYDDREFEEYENRTFADAVSARQFLIADVEAGGAGWTIEGDSQVL